MNGDGVIRALKKKVIWTSLVISSGYWSFIYLKKTFECINQCALQYAETRAEDKSDLLLPGFYKIRDLTW